MLYALANGTDAVVGYAEFTAPPPDLSPGKPLRWLPVIDQQPVPAAGETLAGPVITISADGVTRAWTARPKTYDELLTECYAARRAAYPAIGDQLDAAFKARAGDAAALAAVDAAIAGVKAAYPKPADL